MKDSYVALQRRANTHPAECAVCGKPKPTNRPRILCRREACRTRYVRLYAAAHPRKTKRPPRGTTHLYRREVVTRTLVQLGPGSIWVWEEELSCGHRTWHPRNWRLSGRRDCSKCKDSGGVAEEQLLCGAGGGVWP